MQCTGLQAYKVHTEQKEKQLKSLAHINGTCKNAAHINNRTTVSLRDVFVYRDQSQEAGNAAINIL